MTDNGRKTGTVWIKETTRIVTETGIGSTKGMIVIGIRTGSIKKTIVTGTRTKEGPNRKVPFYHRPSLVRGGHMFCLFR